MAELQAQHETKEMPIVISGCVGPRGDGYDPGQPMSAAEAEAYHAHQIAAFAEAGVDMVTAITMTNVDEATGIARAAQKHDVPVVVSFTLETDGRLPTGQALGAAIAQLDECHGKCAGLLHDHLCSPDAFREHPLANRTVDEAHTRHPCERVKAQPSGAERFA